MDVFILRAHGCAKAGFVHGRAYIGSAACVEKGMQWQHYHSHRVRTYLLALLCHKWLDNLPVKSTLKVILSVICPRMGVSLFSLLGDLPLLESGSLRFRLG